MPASVRRLALIGLAVTIALAAQSTTAAANIPPANTRNSLTSTNDVLVYSGIIVRCTTADATGPPPATGVSAFSETVTFGVGGRCDANGVAATVTCRGFVTLRLTSFAAPSGSGTLALDAGFECTIDVRLAGCRISIVGPQANIGSWSFTNTTQISDIRA